VLFGLPISDATEAALYGELALAGCLTRGAGADPQCQCRRHRSHQWRSCDPHSPPWLPAISRILAGRPHCDRCGGPSTLLVYHDAADVFAADIAEGRATLTDEPAPFRR
jgi:hypothetical protein